MRRLTMAVALATLTGVAHAHHSFAMFDFSREVTLRGTVKEFLWGNPHVFIQLLVPSEGETVEWSIEMNSPLDLARNGWRPGSLKSGDTVTLVIHPLKDGRHGGNCERAINSEGKPIGKPVASKGAGSAP